VGAASKGGFADYLTRLSTISFVSFPAFVLALIFQLIFYGILHIFPSGGRISDFVFLTMSIPRITGFYTIDTLLSGNPIAFIDCVWHLILPVLTLSFYSIGSVTKMTRSMMLETLQEDYILFARANGLKENLILYKYALKNSIIPSLTVVGLSFANLVTGAFTTELIFSWPGLGWFTNASLIELDYPAIIGVVLIGTVFYVGINLIIDITQASLDPRIRLQ
jgi:peptide/nickel transport system permease protein